MSRAAQFDLDDARAYAAWRESKLAAHPRSLDDLIVEIGNPRALTPSERAALVCRCAAANMALYASRCGGDPDKEIPRRLGLQLGLSRLDANLLADDDGISPLTVSATGTRSDFIPYTNRAIKWHTDGYYNAPQRQIRGLLLHCVERADSGGDNRLMDHEIAYILLRDQSPEHIRALMAPDAMTIPARLAQGTVARPPQPGPVFAVAADGRLHMRYTARTVSVEWKDDAATRAAVAALDKLLAGDSPWMLRGRLEPGMGLVCNNVLHDRAAFADSDTRRRLLYRVRYFQRVAG